MIATTEFVPSTERLINTGAVCILASTRDREKEVLDRVEIGVKINVTK